jgi:peptidoglycan hydrolase CwlO-like protein
MAWTEKVWEAFREVLRLQDKVNSVSGQLQEQQRRIEALMIEVAQLRMAVAIVMSDRGLKELPRLPPLDQLKP